MQKKVDKIFFDFETIALELVALNIRFDWEKMFVFQKKINSVGHLFFQSNPNFIEIPEMQKKIRK